MFLFDEAHKLTPDAQNALLKIAEEPPSHVYFVFCSTEPQRIIKTIRSRCTVYQVEPLNDKDMYTLIGHALSYCKAHLHEKIVQGIMSSAQGSPREMLTLVEKVLSVKSDEDRWDLLQEASSSGLTNLSNIFGPIM